MLVTYHLTKSQKVTEECHTLSIESEGLVRKKYKLYGEFDRGRVLLYTHRKKKKVEQMFNRLSHRGGIVSFFFPRITEFKYIKQ